jgi:hypothetical protein
MASRSADGSSQVSVGAAMRARDVSRPGDDDAEAAEESVQVSYRPSSHLPSTGQPFVSRSSRRGGSTPEDS